MNYRRILSLPFLLTLFASFVFTGVASQEKADLDRMPEPKSRAEVVYPEEAKKAGVEGIVYVQVLVDKQGKVTKVKVAKSDSKVLEKAAVDAAKQWTFSPGLSKEKKPVAVWVTLPFKFKLAEGKEKVKTE